MKFIVDIGNGEPLKVESFSSRSAALCVLLAHPVENCRVRFEGLDSWVTYHREDFPELVKG